MKFELPLMIHPNGGVLVLDRLMDLGMSTYWRITVED